MILCWLIFTRQKDSFFVSRRDMILDFTSRVVYFSQNGISKIWMIIGMFVFLSQLFKGVPEDRMAITGTEQRDHIPFGEVSRDHDLEEFDSDLDDSRRDEKMSTTTSSTT